MKEMKISFLLYYSLNFISSTILNLNLHVHALMFITCIKTSLLLKIQHNVHAFVFPWARAHYIFNRRHWFSKPRARHTLDICVMLSKSLKGCMAFAYAFLFRQYYDLCTINNVLIYLVVKPCFIGWSNGEIPHW